MIKRLGSHRLISFTNKCFVVWVAQRCVFEMLKEVLISAKCKDLLTDANRI